MKAFSTLREFQKNGPKCHHRRKFMDEEISDRSKNSSNILKFCSSIEPPNDLFGGLKYHWPFAGVPFRGFWLPPHHLHKHPVVCVDGLPAAPPRASLAPRHRRHNDSLLTCPCAATFGWACARQDPCIWQKNHRGSLPPPFLVTPKSTCPRVASHPPA